MTFEIGIVLFLMIASVVLFALEWVTVDVVGLSVIAILIVTSILTPDQAFSGFSSPAIIMIAGLLVISGGLQHSGITDVIGRKVYQYSGRKPSRLLFFIMSVETAISAFMNNVAATAMLLPGVTALAKKANISASKLLIPLAYASMLGGTCTLIGTSTNVAVNGLLRTYRIEPFGFFEYSPVGIPVAVTGILFMLVFARWILPEHQVETLEFSREYVSEAVVMMSSPLIGTAIAQSGLDKLDLLVAGILRENEQILAPSPQDRFQMNDIILVQGKAEDILKIKSLQGIQMREDIRDRGPLSNINVVEVEVAPRSIFIGKTLKEMNFRQTYGLSVIAIYRKHETVLQKIGLLPLRFGDVLLIQGPQARIDQIKQDQNIIFLNEISYRRYAKWKGLLAVSLFGLVVLLGGLGLFSIAAVAFIGAVLMVLTRVLSLKDAYGSMEWPLLFLIAGMMALGTAMESTGTAQFLAEKIIGLQQSPSPLFLLGAFFVLTVMLTQPLSN
ncbi:MAG TPA: SLC13 family permease, partial [Acidobacteriota bacterium]